MYCSTSRFDFRETCYGCWGPDSSPRDATCKPDLNTALVMGIEIVTVLSVIGICIAYKKFKQQSRNNPERQPLLSS